MDPFDIRFTSSSIDDFFHPPKRQASSSSKIRISSLSDLAGFQFVSDDQLVRTSKKDFWRLGEDDSGPYIERLVDDTQGPVVDF